MLINHTNRHIQFVKVDNLRPGGNGKYFADDPNEIITDKTVFRQGPTLYVQYQTNIVGTEEGIPLVEESIVGVDPIPTVGPDDLIIVTKQYADACRKMCLPTHKLRITVGAVYVEGRSTPIACTGLATVEGCCSAIDV